MAEYCKKCTPFKEHDEPCLCEGCGQYVEGERGKLLYIVLVVILILYLL